MLRTSPYPSPCGGCHAHNGEFLIFNAISFLLYGPRVSSIGTGDELSLNHELSPAMRSGIAFTSPLAKLYISQLCSYHSAWSGSAGSNSFQSPVLRDFFSFRRKAKKLNIIFSKIKLRIRKYISSYHRKKFIFKLLGEGQNRKSKSRLLMFD
jgi:hypothetical protein